MSDGSKKGTSPAMLALYAGSIAGGVECIAVWPMEYMKTQLQLNPARRRPRFSDV